MQYDYSYDGKSVVKRRLEERTRWKEKLPDLKQWAKTQDLLCLYSLNQAYSPLPPKMYGKAAVNKVLPALAAVDQMSIPTSQKPIAVPNRSLYKIPLPLKKANKSHQSHTFDPTTDDDAYVDRYCPSPPNPAMERRVGYTNGCPIYMPPKYKQSGRFYLYL